MQKSYSWNIFQKFNTGNIDCITSLKTQIFRCEQGVCWRHRIRRNRLRLVLNPIPWILWRSERNRSHFRDPISNLCDPPRFKLLVRSGISNMPMQPQAKESLRLLSFRCPVSRSAMACAPLRLFVDRSPAAFSTMTVRVAVISAKKHKRQRRKRQSVTAKREKSQTPKFMTVIQN